MYAYYDFRKHPLPPMNGHHSYSYPLLWMLSYSYLDLPPNEKNHGVGWVLYIILQTR